MPVKFNRELNLHKAAVFSIAINVLQILAALGAFLLSVFTEGHASVKGTDTVSIAAHLPLQGQSGGTDIFEISVFDKVFRRTEQDGRKKSQQSEKFTHLRNLGYYFQYLFDL